MERVIRSWLAAELRGARRARQPQEDPESPVSQDQTEPGTESLERAVEEEPEALASTAA